MKCTSLFVQTIFIFRAKLTLLTCRRKRQLTPKSSCLTTKHITPYCVTKFSNFITIHNHKHITTHSRNYFFSMVQQPPVVQGIFIIEVSHSHSDTTNSLRLLWTSDPSVAETSTWQQTALTRDVHAPGGIRTRNPSRRATANPCLWPRCHWERSGNAIRNLIFLKNYSRPLASTWKSPVYICFYIYIYIYIQKHYFSRHVLQ